MCKCMCMVCKLHIRTYIHTHVYSQVQYVQFSLRTYMCMLGKCQENFQYRVVLLHHGVMYRIAGFCKY